MIDILPKNGTVSQERILPLRQHVKTISSPLSSRVLGIFDIVINITGHMVLRIYSLKTIKEISNERFKISIKSWMDMIWLITVVIESWSYIRYVPMVVLVTICVESAKPYASERVKDGRVCLRKEETRKSIFCILI